MDKQLVLSITIITNTKEEQPSKKKKYQKKTHSTCYTVKYLKEISESRSYAGHFSSPLKNKKAIPEGHTEDIKDSLSFQENKILKMIGTTMKKYRKVTPTYILYHPCFWFTEM